MDKVILKKFAIESRQDLMEKIKNKINTFYIDEEFQSEQKGDVYILSNDKITKNTPKIPAIAPSIDFFGLIFGASLCLNIFPPIAIPTR